MTQNDATNAEFQQFYDMVGVTNVEHCAHCNILLPDAATISLIGMSNEARGAFIGSVVQALGKDLFDLPSAPRTYHTIGELAGHLSQFLLSECPTCKKPVCPLCRSTSEQGLCIDCVSNA